MAHVFLTKEQINAAIDSYIETASEAQIEKLTRRLLRECSANRSLIERISKYASSLKWNRKARNSIGTLMPALAPDNTSPVPFPNVKPPVRTF